MRNYVNVQNEIEAYYLWDPSTTGRMVCIARLSVRPFCVVLSQEQKS